MSNLKINSKAFFSNYIFHPFNKNLTTGDKLKAFVTSVALGVFTAGIFHAACYFKYRNKTVSNPPHNQSSRDVHTIAKKANITPPDDKTQNYETIAKITDPAPLTPIKDETAPQKTMKAAPVPSKDVAIEDKDVILTHKDSVTVPSIATTFETKKGSSLSTISPKLPVSEEKLSQTLINKNERLERKKTIVAALKDLALHSSLSTEPADIEKQKKTRVNLNDVVNDHFYKCINEDDPVEAAEWLVLASDPYCVQLMTEKLFFYYVENDKIYAALQIIDNLSSTQLSTKNFLLEEMCGYYLDHNQIEKADKIFKDTNFNHTAKDVLLVKFFRHYLRENSIDLAQITALQISSERQKNLALEKIFDIYLHQKPEDYDRAEKTLKFITENKDYLHQKLFSSYIRNNKFEEAKMILGIYNSVDKNSKRVRITLLDLLAKEYLEKDNIIEASKTIDELSQLKLKKFQLVGLYDPLFYKSIRLNEMDIASKAFLQLKKLLLPDGQIRFNKYLNNFFNKYLDLKKFDLANDLIKDVESNKLKAQFNRKLVEELITDDKLTEASQMMTNDLELNSRDKSMLLGKLCHMYINKQEWGKASKIIQDLRTSGDHAQANQLDSRLSMEKSS